MSPQHRPGFVNSLLGLFFEPSITVETLLQQRPPPYGNTILACLAVTIFGPLVSQFYRYGVFVFDGNVLLSISVVVGFTFLLFVLVEGLFLNLIGVDVSASRVWALAAYCMTPFLLALWLIYLFNYLAIGRLSLLTLIVTGFLPGEDRFLRVVPVAFLVAQLNMWIVLFYSIRYVASMHWITAAATTILSLVPFYLALLMGLLVGELARPGTTEIFRQILISPLRLTVYGA